MVGKADIYWAGMPHPEINKWSCLPPQEHVSLAVSESRSTHAWWH